ncbi:hypothetical protein NQZ68_027462, partial [Dissostichus eleginoides]
LTQSMLGCFLSSTALNRMSRWRMDGSLKGQVSPHPLPSDKQDVMRCQPFPQEVLHDHWRLLEAPAAGGDGFKLKPHL